MACPNQHLLNHRLPCVRRPRTKNEKSAPLPDEEDYELLTAHQQARLIRRARLPQNLPDSWGDKPVAALDHAELLRRYVARHS